MGHASPSDSAKKMFSPVRTRWSYAVTGDFPGFRPPSGISSKVDSGSHAGSRKKLTGSTKAGGGWGKSRSAAVRTPGGESAATGSSWNGGGVGGGVEMDSIVGNGSGAFNRGDALSRLQSPAAGSEFY